jgi:hypothetical protein
MRVEGWMAEKKTELVSFRATPTFKVALKVASERDKRSQANFLEKLVLDYCEEHGIGLSPSQSPVTRTKKPARAQIPWKRTKKAKR